MKITLNGSPCVIAEDATLDALITAHLGSTRGSAVVVEGEVVPRAAWSRTPLRDGQTVELITAVQGG